MVQIKANPAEVKAFLKTLKRKEEEHKEPRGPRTCNDCMFYNNEKGYCQLVSGECVNSKSRPDFRSKG